MSHVRCILFVPTKIVNTHLVWMAKRLQELLHPNLPRVFTGAIWSDIPIRAYPHHVQQEEMRNDHLFVSGSGTDQYSHLDPRIAAILRRKRVQSGTEEWQRIRQNLLTGTNVASLSLPPRLRASFQLSEEALFRVKAGLKPKKEGGGSTFAQDYGIANEENAARAFAQVTGIELVEEDVGLLQHPDEQWSFLGATPDRLAKYLPVIIEIKCPFKAQIKHRCPEYYMPQVQLQLEICDLDTCFFVQYRPTDLFTDGMLDICVIQRDRDWFAKYSHVFRNFWSRVQTFKTENPNPIMDMTEATTSEESSSADSFVPHMPYTFGAPAPTTKPPPPRRPKKITTVSPPVLRTNPTPIVDLDQYRFSFFEPMDISK